MVRWVAAGLGWLADYMRWKGALGVPLALWHAGFCFLAPRGRRIRAPAFGGRTVRLRARASDLRVYRKIVVQREYELSPDRADAVDRRCARAHAAGRRPLIIDAGGNVGLFSLQAALRWPQADILCVEPHRGNLAMARRNCTGLRNVRFRDAALWSAPGRLQPEDIDAAEGAFAYRAVDEESPAGDVSAEAVTIDALLAERPDAELVMIKMDIEGAEAEALTPEADFWRHRPVILIEPHDFLPGRTATLRGLLAQEDFRDADWEIRGEGLLIFPTERPERELHGRAPLAIAAAS
ncbi:FkbM family methyltransferase [Albimonas sp. CAU 1670]|uniref:FkbM family methyltransferase n=1 Tax=Albimonas sp. CAU 1670 TaxID=3032599 RepID=UPI0023DAC8E8|nr:FkbM family methyltransferase [Albimonas sp. CAU 1670]MDF2232861.1 FkbM family methyltransferase [Albimonas sp. CAU 1670]